MVGPIEILVVALFILFLFGARKLPEIGRSLGWGMREFKEAVTSGDEPEKHEPEKAAPAARPTTVTTPRPAPPADTTRAAGDAERDRDRVSS